MTGPWPRWYRPPVVKPTRAMLGRTAIAAAASYTGLTAKVIKGQERRVPVTRARWAVMAALRCHGWSTPRIGAVLGNRDHTTILYGLKRGSELYAVDPAFRQLCSHVEAAA